MDKLIKAAKTRFNKKTINGNLFARDIDTLINQYDSNKLLGLSRGLYHNNPLVKSAIEQKAAYAIGSAFEYRSLSKDDNAKNKFNDAMRQWSKICDVSGMTLNDVAYLMSVKVDVDGDLFVLLTETKDGYPQIQVLESHSIGSRQSGRIDRGNLWEEKGVLYDKKTKRPIRYRILAPDEKNDKLVSARDIIRVSEPSLSLRGIPLVSSCINLLYDLEHSQELLLIQHLLAATISMIETNESGSNEINLNDAADETPYNVEVMNHEGGEIRYHKAGSGSKLEFLTNQNPHTYWQEYQDTLTNIAILALDWSRNLLGMSSGTGVNDRLAIQQCSKACLDRQVLLAPYMARICNYAISKLIKNGYLNVDLPADYFECQFTKPKQLTVDFARDGKQILEDYKAGIKNLGQILAEEGIDHDEHVLERCREEARRKLIKKQVEEEYGVEIDDLDTRLLSQNQFTQPKEDVQS
jgi:capsid protein